ncbi:MAG: DUF6508 domain-containing protein [Candidatus Margulisbacteria bacterium]|nr:DUF6508 domain-containing protein [Candidatus Margulisiibacteriota bacterium]
MTDIMFNITELQSIKNILQYYDYFNNPDNVFFTTTTFSGAEYTKEVYDFMSILIKEKFVLPGFDWASWDEGRKILKDSTNIMSSDLLTLKKLLTAIVRNDRFCAGAFGGFAKNGKLGLILKRMSELIANN